MPANRIKKEPAYERRAKRQQERKPKIIACRILIVCEGEKTEPYYFRSFDVINNGSFVYDITAKGYGLNTVGVVDKAIELNKKNDGLYDAVWAVFDKDSFSDDNFNRAIDKAEQNNINVAWSNEAFELWYLLHFQYRNTPMCRDDYQREIAKAVNAKSNNKLCYSYKKNNKDNCRIINEYGSLDDAIRNAKKLHDTFVDNSYSKHNPCTTVYKLVLQLLDKDTDLINRVMDKINS